MKYGRTALSDVVPAELVGLRNRLLARILGINQSTLRDWRALGIPFHLVDKVKAIKFPSLDEFSRKPTEFEKNVAEAYRNGKTVRDLAEEVYLTPGGVSALLKRAMPDYKDAKEWSRNKGIFRWVWTRVGVLNRRKARVERALLCCYDDAVAIIGEGKSPIDRRQKTPSAAFLSQRSNAARRGIGWELTFVQWWKIWRDSGHWEQRGRGQGYCMARIGDTGPYAVGNVEIKTIGENFSESYYKHPWKERFKQAADRKVLKKIANEVIGG